MDMVNLTASEMVAILMERSPTLTKDEAVKLLSSLSDSGILSQDDIDLAYKRAQAILLGEVKKSLDT